MTLATYHNHTTWSDGKATPAELLDAARRAGIDELGISDHLVIHPKRQPPSWSMALDRLGDYFDELSRLRQESRRTGGPVVRIGLEVDYFPGHDFAIWNALSEFDFDFLIGSVHEVDGFPIDGSSSAWDGLSLVQRNRVHRRYWAIMRSLAKSRLFNIAAHLDLPKKFGHFPAIDLSNEISEALDAILESKMVLELNTSGWHKPCNDAYPSREICGMAHQRNIGVTISSDAHQSEHLVRDFARGANRLRTIGFTKIARFAGGAVTFEPIASWHTSIEQPSGKLG